jgi:hypothetical protein
MVRHFANMDVKGDLKVKGRVQSPIRASVVSSDSFYLDSGVQGIGGDLTENTVAVWFDTPGIKSYVLDWAGYDYLINEFHVSIRDNGQGEVDYGFYILDIDEALPQYGQPIRGADGKDFSSLHTAFYYRGDQYTEKATQGSYPIVRKDQRLIMSVYNIIPFSRDMSVVIHTFRNG